MLDSAACCSTRLLISSDWLSLVTAVLLHRSVVSQHRVPWLATGSRGREVHEHSPTPGDAVRYCRRAFICCTALWELREDPQSPQQHSHCQEGGSPTETIGVPRPQACPNTARCYALHLDTCNSQLVIALVPFFGVLCNLRLDYMTRDVVKGTVPTVPTVATVPTLFAPQHVSMCPTPHTSAMAVHCFSLVCGHLVILALM
jgi:hypothetical protein